MARPPRPRPLRPDPGRLLTANHAGAPAVYKIRVIRVHLSARATNRRHRYFCPAAIVAVLAVAGCGDQSEPARESGRQIDTKTGGLTVTGTEKITKILHGAIPPPRPWAKPVFRANDFPTLAKGEAAIKFEPLAPTKLGPPAAIYVGPTAVPVGDLRRFIVFVYDHPTFGIFYIEERKVHGSVALNKASIVGLGTCPPGWRCPARRSLAVLADGRKAALLLSPDKWGANSIAFIDAKRALWIDILGPPDSFDARKAVAVANLLVG